MNDLDDSQNLDVEGYNDSLNYDKLKRLRHSAAHIMADAVKQLYPAVQLTIGPATDDGFYYDFDAAEPFSAEDLIKIEAKMQEIVAAKHEFKEVRASRGEAIERFKALGEHYKVEIIEALPEDAEITYYQHGDFIDLCRGPHVENTSQVKAIKLLKVAGAYWRGDEKNAMLQRIYGTAFSSPKELRTYLKFLEEAAKRDHRRLGKDLKLFSSMEAEGPGLILWLPKGARIRQVLEDYWREEHRKADYEIVYSPHMAKLDLWRTSGHVDFYQDSMFSPMEVDGQEYEIKPMNCPFHIRMVQQCVNSYRDFPLRFAELGTVYRYERSGTLHGLLRVRGFTQDDAHLFCLPEQMTDEVGKVLKFIFEFLGAFGFKDFEVYLSTRPEKSVGSDENWELATNALKTALEEQKIKYAVDPGEGVFYGPKIDIKIKDVLGRSWQCSTVQVDFNNPERFNMTYTDSDSQKKRPIMIHRALMGSLERFFGILIEHYAGQFPLWLAPTQVKILSVSAQQSDYALEIYEQLREEGIRSELDTRSEKLGLKIREAQLEKVPYSLILGQKEQDESLITYRHKKSGEQGTLKLTEFIDRVRGEIQERSDR